MGPDGNLYVTDARQRVNVIAPAGAVIRRWGRPGSGPGEFRFVTTDPSDPEDIAMDVAVDRNGLVYVADSGNARIEIFTSKGRLVRQLRTFGKRHERFVAPWDLVVDAGGNLYVDDGQLNTISKFSPRGELIWSIGGPEAADPDLRAAGFLASVDAHGRVVMANDVAGRILYVDARGHKVDAFGSHDDFSTGPCYVTVDALGYTYVDSCGPHPAATWVFDRNHRLVGEWIGPDDPLGTSPLFAPDGRAFALGWDGSILQLKVALPGA